MKHARLIAMLAGIGGLTMHTQAGIEFDCNLNGVEDAVDIASGVSTDCDGDVAVDDVLRIISMWGHGAVVADVNFDGTVNVNDMLALLNQWGPCPE